MLVDCLLHISYELYNISEFHLFNLENIYHFQVVVVTQFDSITPSLPIRHLETRGSSHMTRQGMLVGKIEFNSYYVDIALTSLHY